MKAVYIKHLNVRDKKCKYKRSFPEIFVCKLCTTNQYYKKMVTILHREPERKVEKVKDMRLEVMRPKTKNNMNFQPE